MHENRIDFVKTAISDAQDLIKFIEAKIGFLVAILVGYITLLCSWKDTLLKYGATYSWQFWVILIVQVVLIAICVVMAYIAIRPVEKPAAHIDTSVEAIPDLPFYIAPNKYHNFWKALCHSDKYKLDESYGQFVPKIINASDELILKSLSFELFKISFIRNLKSDRLKDIVRSVTLTSFWLVITVLFYSVETNTSKAKEKIEKQKSTHVRQRD